MTSERTPPAYLIEAVDNALLILLELRFSESIRVSDVAARLGIARSTAHRLLSTLRHRDFVVQNPDRSYRAGPALPRPTLGQLTSVQSVLELIRPVMARLSADIDETVHLVVRHGTDAVFLHSEESRQALRISSRTGYRLPAHTVSGGKALLAASDPAEVEELYAPIWPPEQRAEFARQLARIRRRGYALNRGESEAGVGAVGVVIRDPTRVPRAALTISVPLMRLTRDRVAELAAAVRAGAEDVGLLLR